MSGLGDDDSFELSDDDIEWLDTQLQHTEWSERKAARRARRRARVARVLWWVRPGQVVNR